MRRWLLAFVVCLMVVLGIAGTAVTTFCLLAPVLLFGSALVLNDRRLLAGCFRSRSPDLVEWSTGFLLEWIVVPLFFTGGIIYAVGKFLYDLARGGSGRR